MSRKAANAPVTFKPDPAFAAALAKLLARVAAAIGPVERPIKVCIAGGTALHLYTGARYSNDVDAKVFARVLLPENDLQLAYADSAGRTRILYFDTQFNDSFALLHHEAYDDAQAISVEGVDARRLALHVLTPLDLAVSKVARFSAQDREDIRTLARERLIDSAAFQARAESALPDYVGNLQTLAGHIGVAVKDIEQASK